MTPYDQIQPVTLTIIQAIREQFNRQSLDHREHYINQLADELEYLKMLPLAAKEVPTIPEPKK